MSESSGKALFRVAWREKYDCEALVEASDELEAQELVYDHGKAYDKTVKRTLVDWGDWSAAPEAKEDCDGSSGD